MGKPKFSVIIPALNEEKFLPKLLASLAEQNERDFEVIVIDGSSKDKTIEVAKSFQTKLPSLVVEISKIASLPLQRNLGVKRANGEWFIFIDADSVLLPYFFERISEFINREHPQLFTTWFRPDSEVGSDALLTLMANMLVEGSLILHRQLSPGPLTMVKRQAFDMIGGYDETLKFSEDYDFAQRLSSKGISLKILREALYVWSMRRIRKEGKLKMFQFYAKVSLRALITKKIPGDISGYIMGGHLYNNSHKQEVQNKSGLNKLEKKLRFVFRQPKS